MPKEAAKLVERSLALQKELDRLSKELSDLQRQVSEHLEGLHDEGRPPTLRRTIKR